MTTPVSTLRQLATEYQSLGLPAIPAYRGRPLVLWQPYQQRLPEPEEVEGWPWQKADAVAVICGHPAPGGGFWWVLDIEHQHRAEAERWLDETHPGWRHGLVARSQRDGLHVYCLSRQPVRTTKHRWGDVKGAGSLIFAPPSKAYKPDAVGDYQWLSYQPQAALWLEPSDLPWPSDNGHRRELLGETLKLERTIPIGSRNTVLTRVAGWLRGEGQLEPDEVLAVLRMMNRRCEEPLPDQELEAIARSSSRWSPNPVLVVSNGKHEFVSSHRGDDREETNSVPDSWQPVALSALDGDSTSVEWLWDGFLAKGHLTDFYALWKAGKTTLLAALLQRMEHGGELAGRTVRPGKALVVTEEPKAKWVERREALALGDHVHIVSRPFPKRPNHAEWHTFTSHVTRLVVEHGYDLVVFDALPNLWPVRDENDASETVTALLPLQAIATAGCAVLFVRHPRKSDGSQATAGRGSGAIAGFVDIIIEMRRYEPEQQQDTRRVLSVYSRYEPFEMVIRWAGDGQYETLGTPAAYSAEAQRQRLLEALAEQDGATTADLAKAVELPYATVSKRLGELEAAGQVVRAGTGKRGDPYRWFLANGDDDPDGDDFFSSRYTPMREEKKSDDDPGKHHIPHGEAQKASHDPVGHASRAVTGHSLYSDGDSDHDPGKPKNPHQNYEKTSRTPANPQGGFFSSRYTPNREEKKIPGETDFSHGEAKKTSRTPDDFFSSRYTPRREEKKTDGIPENPHQNCKKASRTPADHTSGSSDEHENPHQNCKKTSRTCVVCGRALLQVSGQSALYCSTACKTKAYRQRQSSADTPGRVEPEPLAVEGTTLTLTPFTSVNVNESRHQQRAPGRVTPGSLATETNGHPPDPGTCLDCHQPITDPGFSYRCPRCLKARLDRLGWEYPEKLVRWLQTHDQKEGRR
jgi:hypothetical protein